MMLAEETKQRTDGFFNIKKPDGTIDPSGIVKGWAIYNASKIIEAAGLKNFFVDAGGDIQAHGTNGDGKPWSIGIKNPFKQNEIVKTLFIKDANGKGIATSGTYIRGEHIYNPKDGFPANAIASLTVIGQNIYEADRWATAAFAMGANGIHFIEKLVGFEGYMIDNKGVATMTTGFENYL
jgi:thiamine biosynthesis lipoprotein